MKQQKTANYDRVTATSRGSYLMHAHEHNKVFINKIEKTRTISTNSKVIIKDKLKLLVNYNLTLVIN